MIYKFTRVRIIYCEAVSHSVLCDPMVYTRQAPLSMEFSRQEWWRGLPFPSPGDLPNPGIEPRPPLLHTDSLLSEPPEKSTLLCVPIFFLFPFSLFVFDTPELFTSSIPVCSFLQYVRMGLLKRNSLFSLKMSLFALYSQSTVFLCVRIRVEFLLLALDKCCYHFLLASVVSDSL